MIDIGLGPTETGYLVVAVYTISLSLFAAVGFLVYRDARARGSERAWLWGLGVYVLLGTAVVPGLVLFLIYRQRRPSAAESADPTGDEPRDVDR